ncbi:MAG: hypothetical protein HKM86_08645 [Deltaproteobacteria bacterium]|nr:hypothetical protein [Deltaproteobacteria bacterium]
MRILVAALLLISYGFVYGADTVPKGGNPVVLLETSMGNIKVELDPEKAPVSVKIFPAYVNEGHYDDLIFHRVIRDFMIQGVGFTEEMREKRLILRYNGKRCFAIPSVYMALQS